MMVVMLEMLVLLWLLVADDADVTLGGGEAAGDDFDVGDARDADDVGDIGEAGDNGDGG